MSSDKMADEIMRKQRRAYERMYGPPPSPPSPWILQRTIEDLEKRVAELEQDSFPEHARTAIDAAMKGEK